MIRFRKITKINYWDIVDLNAGDNRKFVAPNSEFLLSAIFNNRLSTAKAIYYNKKPIGMTYFYNTEKYTFIAQFMIDKKYQGKGYGKIALTQVIDYVKSFKLFNEIKTSYVPTDNSAEGFYKNFGFIKSKKVIKDSDEIVMKYLLN